MNEADLYIVLDDLRRDESFRSHPYLDTEGNLTIGYGRNLDANGISKDEAEIMLRNNVMETIDELKTHITIWKELDGARKRALINMGFQMGWPRLRKFVKMLAAIEAGYFELASKEVLNSRYAKQVPGRASRVAALIRFGEEHD
jgi:lysozyme